MSNSDLYNAKPDGIVMYSASWCPDCKRSKQFLAQHNIQYLDVDIGKDNEAFLFVERLTRRVRIPTMIVPDGSIMIEPDEVDLSRKLGIKLS